MLEVWFLLFKDDLQIVLTNVPAQVGCDWVCVGKGFRDICDFGWKKVSYWELPNV